MGPVIIQIVTIVEGYLFTRRDVARGNDPDTVIFQLCLGVGRATMIYEACKVARDAAIKIEFLIDVEDIIIAFAATPRRLLFGDPLSSIFDNPVTGENFRSGEHS